MQKTMTPVERKYMNILWEKERCFVNDIMSEIAEPKPPYTTVSSVIRILEKKGFVGHKQYGNTYEYYPIITKEEHKKVLIEEIINSYFDGSFRKMIAFYGEKIGVDITETEAMTIFRWKNNIK